jgi:hypothetical protein
VDKISKLELTEYREEMLILKKAKLELAVPSSSSRVPEKN